VVSSAHIYFSAILGFSAAVGTLSALTHLAYNLTFGRNQERVNPLWTLVTVTLACLAVAGIIDVIGTGLGRRAG
jgi:hypothetical protein